MSQLRIFSYLPNPRIWKATIAARLCGVEIEVRGAPPTEPLRSPRARTGRRGLSPVLDGVRREAGYLSRHTVGWEDVRSVLARTPIEAWVAHAGVPLADVERAVDMILAARSMVVRVELGIQQSRHSTLNSYLEKLLYLVTGNFGRRGTNGIHTWLLPLIRDSQGERSSARPASRETAGGARYGCRSSRAARSSRSRGRGASRGRSSASSAGSAGSRARP